MALLKKIKGATLMETLVATVLIMVIFIISGLVLNNVFSSSVRNHTKPIETIINELRYLEANKKITLPYDEEIDSWKVSLERITLEGQNFLEIEAVNIETQKSISKKYIENNN